MLIAVSLAMLSQKAVKFRRQQIISFGECEENRARHLGVGLPGQSCTAGLQRQLARRIRRGSLFHKDLKSLHDRDSRGPDQGEGLHADPRILTGTPL